MIFKEFDFKEARKKLLGKKLCDRCLGRQFTQLFQGHENAVIGKAIREKETEKQVEKLLEEKDLEGTEGCKYCDKLFQKEDEAVEKAIDVTENIEFHNFLVGVRVPKKIENKEEKLWEEAGANHCEPIKKDLKRNIGKKIAEKTGKEAEFKRPEIVFLFKFTEDEVKLDLNINSMFIYGEYQKNVRDLPQTKWYCRKCHGKGCDYCNYKGKMYEESVEELIAPEIVKASGGEEEKFHGAGREDIDTKQLGWRPFTIEVMEPIRRDLDFQKLAEETNKKAENKVKVRKLRPSSKKEMQFLKKVKMDKTYRIKIDCEKEPEKEQLREVEKKLDHRTLSQKTPTRVAHRRADKVRKREVRHVECKKDGKGFTMEVKTESGTYIKELVTGNEERTHPSVSGILGIKCTPEQLDVIKVHKRKFNAGNN